MEMALTTMKKRKKEDFVIPFWKKWLEADTFEKQELVKKLHLFDMALQMKNTKLSKNSFAAVLNSYFEDLEYACLTRSHSQDTRKKKRSGKKILTKDL